MLISLLAQAVSRPLRWLGIDRDPHRALLNATPDSRQTRADRVEQFAFIAGNFARTGEQLALVTRAGPGSADDEVSVLVFERDRLVAHPTSLDRPLRDSFARVARSN